MNEVRRLGPALLAALLGAAALTACGSTVHGAARSAASRNTGDDLGATPSAAANPAADNSGTAINTGTNAVSGASTAATTPGAQRAANPRTQPRQTGPIEVGFLNQTFASAGQFGINTPAGHTSRQTYDAVINALNAKGGLDGRKIVPVFANVNLTGNWAADYQSACSAFTEDHHVVAVLGYSLLLNDAFESCLTKRGVVHLSAGSPNGDDEVLRANPNLFMTAYPTADGVYATQLTGALAMGAVTRTSKIGVLRFDCDWDVRAWKHVGQPFIDANRLNVVKTQLMSCPTNAGDVVGANQSQVQSAVLQFKAAGVDTVIANGTAQTFSKSADSQGYTPKYVITTVDTSQGLQTQNVPDRQLRNMFGVGWYPILDTDATHRPAPPAAQKAAQQRCVALAKASSYDPTDADLQQLFTTCDTLFLYERALSSTSGATAAVLVDAAVIGLGSAYASTTALDGVTRFSASRRTAPAAWRPFAWNTGCACFLYSGASRQMP